MASELKPDYVITPSFESGSGDEPPESGRDVVEVMARTKRDAIRAAMPRLRAIRGGWLHYCDGNPFVGLKAELARCEHGVAHFAIVDGKAVYATGKEFDTGCPACEAQLQAEWEISDGK